MQTNTATTENSVEIPLKTGNRTAIQSSNPTAGHTHQGKPELKETCVPQCSSQHYLQQLGHGSNLDAHRLVNG